MTGSLSGLQPGTTYYYQGAATNAAGTNYGNVISFTTPAAAPSVTTDAASGLTTSGATLNAIVSANGAATSVTFCYAPANSEVGGVLQNCIGGAQGASTGSPTQPTDSGVAASLAVSGLNAATTYYVQAIATNTGGTS